LSIRELEEIVNQRISYYSNFWET